MEKKHLHTPVVQLQKCTSRQLPLQLDEMKVAGRNNKTKVADFAQLGIGEQRQPRHLRYTSKRAPKVVKQK